MVVTVELTVLIACVDIGISGAWIRANGGFDRKRVVNSPLFSGLVNGIKRERLGWEHTYRSDSLSAHNFVER